MSSNLILSARKWRKDCNSLCAIFNEIRRFAPGEIYFVYEIAFGIGLTLVAKATMELKIYRSFD